DPTPPTLRIGAAAQRIHHTVQIRADPQPVQADVVADVDHGGDLGARLTGVCPYSGEEPRPPDPSGQYHDTHRPILAYPGCGIGDWVADSAHVAVLGFETVVLGGSR